MSEDGSSRFGIRRIVSAILPGSRYHGGVQEARVASNSRPTTLMGSNLGGDYIDDQLRHEQAPQQHHQQHQPQHQQSPPLHHHQSQPTGLTAAFSRQVEQPHGILPENEIVNPNDQLRYFRSLAGIHNAASFDRIHAAIARPATNVGLYGRIVQAEQSAMYKYKVFTILVNGCLALQLIVAAALTALGAGNGPHGLVTAFGAVNTVIAGFLTYLKGSGLPHKLKYYETQWTALREFVEQREREFCREGCLLDAEQVVADLELLYEGVKSDIEVNTSEGVVSGGSKAGGGGAPHTALAASMMRGGSAAQHPDDRPGLSRGVSYSHSKLRSIPEPQSATARDHEKEEASAGQMV